MTIDDRGGVATQQASGPTPPVTPQKGRDDTASRLVSKYAFVALFAAMVVIFEVLRPESFGTLDNLQQIINNSSRLVIFGCAVTLVLSCAEFDLSFPSLADMTNILVGLLVTSGGLASGMSITLAVLLGLAASVLMGFASGLAVAYGKVPSFIATLAVGSVAGGLELALQGRIPGGLTQIPTVGLPTPLMKLGSYEVLGTGLRVSVLVAIVIAIITFVILRYSVLGRRIQAVGGNDGAAFLAAVPVARVRVVVFTLSALFAGIAGIIGLSENGYYATASTSLLLPAYTVAFLGTAFLAAGRFTVIGTLVSVLFINTLSNGLGLLNQPNWIVSVISGAVLIAAVLSTRRGR